MSEDTYLHSLNGGFDNNIRREIRKLFRNSPAQSTDEIPECVDFVIGVLEEFYYIGIKEFTALQVVEAFRLFNFPFQLTVESVDATLRHQRVQVYSTESSYYQLPNLNRLNVLKGAFCTIMKKRRMEEFGVKV